MKKTKHPNLRRRILLSSFAVVVLGALVGSSIAFYNYVNEQLYKESIAQLAELTDQLFQKLEVQVDLQWDYLDRFKDDIQKSPSWSEEDIAEAMSHLESDLSPKGKSIKFRVLDEDDYFYTNEGKQGHWQWSEDLTDKEKDSFVMTNFGDQDYMAFVAKPSASILVNGRSVSRFILLRTMKDMSSFFTSTAFKNNNLAYVINPQGRVLYRTGELEGIDPDVTNLNKYLEEQNFPHESFASLKEKTNNGERVYADVVIDGERFFLTHDPLKQYYWEITLLVSASDVATSATSMVSSLSILFLTIGFIFLIFIGVGVFFITKLGRDKALIQLKEENQAALEQTNKELNEAKLKTEEALAVAKYATNAKSQFLANMSHDIRTPMNAIVGISKLMENEINNPEKLSYYVNKLHHSSEYMLGLINDILDMSKIESGDVHLNMAPVKMAEQVGQIESIIRAQSNEKNQEFTVIAHEIRHEYLIGDSVRLRQMFMNLLSNAVKYTQNEGHILFELKEVESDKEGYAKILTSVEDDGYGMSEEFQKKMFEPFAREVNSLTNKVSGTGLGLPITKNIIEMMGGTIECRSAIGKGSRFDVWLNLPIDQDSHASKEIAKVLLVSQEEMLITNLRSSLSEREAELIVVPNEEDALSYLDKNSVDVVLLSGYLSKKDLKAIVTKLKGKRSLYVFCVDYAYKERVRDTLISSGVDGLIARPFFYENLLIAMENAKKKSQEDEEAHSFLKGKRFLCAEDNELNAEILEALLAMQGASCKIYSNGEEIVKAFASVKPGDYDAILMDVQMPVMNGLEATKAIRESENPLGKKMIIIAMTANAFNSDVKECLDVGMDAHLSKPLDIAAFEHLLQRLMG